MSTDSEFLPPHFESETAPLYLADSIRSTKRVRSIPNFGDLAVFAITLVIVLLLIEALAFGLAQWLHWFPHQPLTQMAQNPRLILPTMFVTYLVATLVAIIVFTVLWRLPFAEGIRWDLAPIARRGWLLLATGVGVSIVVQLLSNYLPMPKELPIDEFFKTPLDVWLVAFFGVFVAPPFEELAFRGFLLPALANTWDYIGRRYRSRRTSRLEATHFEEYGETLPESLATVEGMPETSHPLQAFIPVRDPEWSLPALVFASTLSSIGFAYLHADQLAHAYSPLAVLFCVSLILCVVRIRWHSLAASALVHACYNGTIFAMLFIATSGFRHLEKLKQ